MNGEPIFRDRRHAGRLLGARLRELDLDEPVVVALPRGGVPVAYEVAQALDAPLDIGLVRKLGAPGHSELGIGALGENGVVVLDRGAVAALGVTRAELAQIVASEQTELERRQERYRRDLLAVELAGHDVVVVDDGVATGVTAAAAGRILRVRGAARKVLAVPVGPPGAGKVLERYFDQYVTLAEPPGFGSVGAWYADFSQTSDEEVVDLLRASRRDRPPSAPCHQPQSVADPEVSIPTREHVRLPGSLLLPEGHRPRGLIVFVHGSGSSRRSPRNVAVARALAARGFATLLFDLLTEPEAADRHNVFDISLLTRRLLDVTEWTRSEPRLAGLPVGYFGASTGAGAALAAAELGEQVRAVVSRGGRPDLADKALPQVTAPTLLIVGGDDWYTLERNDEAADLLTCPHDFVMVLGAGHLFEEPGALEQVSELAGNWFDRCLSDVPSSAEVDSGSSGTSQVLRGRG